MDKDLSELMMAFAMEPEEIRRVGLDEVDGFRVSTVYLGIDHSHGYGPPLLYETMVFAGGDYMDLYCERYTTREQAEEGHKVAIQWVKDGGAQQVLKEREDGRQECEEK